MLAFSGTLAIESFKSVLDMEIQFYSERSTLMCQ